MENKQKANGVEPQFHLFPDLHTEIRLKIWQLVLDTTRTVNITCEKGVHPGPRRYAKAFSCDDHEAQAEAFSVYKLYFMTEFSPKYTYVAFNRNIIKLTKDGLSYFPGEGLEHIQRMSIVVMDYSYFAHFNMDILKQMKSLRELELLAGDGTVYRWNRGENPYVTTLVNDFAEAAALDPGWECPRVSIVFKYHWRGNGSH
jgi:hypothetical protein